LTIVGHKVNGGGSEERQ